MILPEEDAHNYEVGTKINIKMNTANSYLFSSDTGVNITPI